MLLLYCFVPHSCHSLHPAEHEFYEGNEYLSSLPADADRTEDFEYEVRPLAHCSLSVITDMVLVQIGSGSCAK